MNRWPQVWDDPVLNKEVRQRMRFSRTPWIVFLYLGIMGFLIFTYMFLMEKEQFLNSEENRFLFMGLALIHLMLLAFVVPGLTAGTISGERERQTLSVLLTLPLSSSGIIFSKWLASIAFVILLIVASLPLYASVFLFGGVSPGEILYTFVHLLITVCFLGALGVFVSTQIRRTGPAMVTAYVAVAMILVGIPVLMFFIALLYDRFLWDSPHHLPLPFELLAGLHPVITQLAVFFGEQMGLGLQWRIDIYWMYVSAYALLTVGLLVAASYFLSPARWNKWSFFSSRSSLKKGTKDPG